MLAIYRHHIRRGVETGVDSGGMPEPDDLRQRRKNLHNHRLPHLAATWRGEIVGYAYVVLFRKRPAYRYTAKHSIYVHHEHLGRGVGRLLLQDLMDACAAAGFRQMIGYIDADNTASLALHEKFGFSRAGLLPAVAYRYGRWADTVMMQRSLGAGATEPPSPAGFGR
jgi:L-amino acid N-acyltransferase YncA